MTSNSGLKILAVSDSREYLLILKEYATKMGVFSNFYFAFNGEEAIEKFEDYRPDILLLDLILPKIDGLGVMEIINERGIKGSTKIIVSSGIGGDFFINRSFEYGADYFFIKPIAYKTFRGRVLDLLNDTSKKQEQQMLDEGSLAQTVTSIIQRLGLPVGSKGYQFARYGIQIALEDKTILKQMTKRFYPAIAEAFDSTPSRVERDIRHAVEVGWNKGDIAYIEKLFGYTVDADRGKPTNSAFIATIVDYIELNLLKVD